MVITGLKVRDRDRDREREREGFKNNFCTKLKKEKKYFVICSMKKTAMRLCIFNYAIFLDK
jgi:hypothetical protein